MPQFSQIRKSGNVHWSRKTPRDINWIWWISRWDQFWRIRNSSTASLSVDIFNSVRLMSCSSAEAGTSGNAWSVLKESHQSEENPTQPNHFLSSYIYPTSHRISFWKSLPLTLSWITSLLDAYSNDPSRNRHPWRPLNARLSNPFALDSQCGNRVAAQRNNYPWANLEHRNAFLE